MKPSARKGRILVIRGGAIGDFILTLPVIAALRRQFPEAHLEVLGYPHIVQLALTGGLVDQVRPIESRALAGFFASGGDLSAELRDYFSEFDIIVSFLYDPDQIFQSNVARCAPAQFIVAPHRPDEKERLHATQVFLKPLERLAIFDADPVPRLFVHAPRNGHPVLAVHPGSGSERKNWPETRWSALLGQLVRETSWNLLLVGGEAEVQRLKRLVGNLPADRCSVAQNLPLADLAHRLASCGGFVGHDSGISHLAAALGLPCVVLWADTIEEVWRPQGDRVVVVKEFAGIHHLKVERVATELARMFPSTHGCGSPRLGNDPQSRGLGDPGGLRSD